MATIDVANSINYRSYSMNKQYDVAVFIGRFHPLHNAHAEMLKDAADMADKVIVIMGSAGQPRTFKNPFTDAERADMVLASTNSLNVNCIIEANHDTIYNDQAWAVRIQTIVSKHTTDTDKIVLIGHEKDETSFYLHMFPQWHTADCELKDQLNATDIRDLYFKQDANLQYLKCVVPEFTFNFLTEFKDTQAYNDIIVERNINDAYKKQYAGLPYEPIFVTTDAVVVQDGHVLLVKRRAYPGKGLWALPGGFVNAATDKSVQDAMIRELKEETRIKVPKPVLVGNIQRYKVFDAIGRSSRGRTITHAFHIQLPYSGNLPSVKGSDDAEKAVWMPIGSLKSEEFFEDHFEIIHQFVGI